MAADGDARCIGRVSVGIFAATGRRRWRRAVAGAAPPGAKSDLQRCRLVAADAVSGPVLDSRRSRASRNNAGTTHYCRAPELAQHCDLRGGRDVAVEHREQRVTVMLLKGLVPQFHGARSAWLL